MTVNAAWFAPGRIEVLGKHTDYAGGNVLVCATEAGVTATAHASTGGWWARSAGHPDRVDLGAGARPLPPGHWGRYPATVLRRLQRNFGPLRPAELVIDSTLPEASGLSSSSALIVACALALADLNNLPAGRLWRTEVGDGLRLAGYLASVENGSRYGALAGDDGVGTRGGSEDHVAMLCSRPGELGWFDFSPPAPAGAVPLPPEWTFVVAVSGVRAEKTGAALPHYNRAADAARSLLRRWNGRTGRADATLASAVRSGLSLTEPGLDDVLRDRLSHFIEESERIVPAAVEALRRDDLRKFGDLAGESQQLAASRLGNQVPATVDLARAATRLGAVASSAFGAGFGGSVWALVRRADADEFATAWLADHRARFDAPAARPLITRPAGPARPEQGPVRTG